jgi:hypothetical protein
MQKDGGFFYVVELLMITGVIRLENQRLILIHQG